MPTSHWDSDKQQIIIAIESAPRMTTVRLMHSQQPQSTIWQMQSPITDWGILLQQVNNSLAQVPHIDTIIHTIQQESTSDNWQFGIQLCILLPLPLMIQQSLAYVVCIDDQHAHHLEIEAYFRKQSLIWANQRVRINCIRQQHPTSEPDITQQFLMGTASRVLTGALFLADGQMLMGGHPTAERIITQQCMLHQID
jgi:hypothetical protein